MSHVSAYECKYLQLLPEDLRGLSQVLLVVKVIDLGRSSSQDCFQLLMIADCLRPGGLLLFRGSEAGIIDNLQSAP